MDIDPLIAELRGLRLSRPVGHAAEVVGSAVRVTGLSGRARVGDWLTLRRNGRPDLTGEVGQIRSDHLVMLPDAPPEGVSVGDRVLLSPPPVFAPGDHWIGRVIDPFGRPLDGRSLLRGTKAREVIAPPPPAHDRAGLGARLDTGQAVLNTLLPLVQGQRVGLFAGSGVGKSHLLATLARQTEADVIVIALIGERGREVREFVTQVLGDEGMRRSVVIAATSDRPAMHRRRCALAAMTVAEHFRDQGRNVLFLADSITRLAEAHREIALAGGEAPALRGHPPSITPLITGLTERAGPGRPGQGSITAVFSVLVPGSDMDEPVADILRGVLDGHVVLSRDIAERGRFPAIDVGRSVSRALPQAASADENALITEARRLLGAYERSEVMLRAGLYVEGADPVLDQAVRAWPDLDQFFAASGSTGIAGCFDRLRLILRRSAGAGPRAATDTG